MTIAYVEPLLAGWERMKRILFRPFDLGKWLVLGFAAWLAGLGGNETFRWVASDEDELSLAGGGFLPSLGGLAERPLVLLAVALGLMIVVAIAVAFLWLSSRSKLIFLDCVVHDRAAIVEPWRRLKTLGDSLFVWRLGFYLAVAGAMTVVALLLVGPAVLLERGPDAVRGVSIASMLVGLLAAVVIGVMTAFVALMLDSFIVPIMYKYGLGAMDAWRCFVPWLTANTATFLLYAGFSLLLAIGVGIGVLLAGLLTLCCGLILVALPYVGAVILLPLHVTFRVFSLEFLAQLDPGFDLLDGLNGLATGAGPAPSEP